MAVRHQGGLTVMADAAAIHLEMLEAVNRHDVNRFRELLHADYTYLGTDGVEHQGPEAGVAQVEPFVTAFPDLRLGLDHHHSCGDVSVIEFTARGTHKAELAGIPATGKPIAVIVCDVIEVRDGKVYREREYYDQMTMMQQLGVMPAE
jgi:steroid delta-isomerase-like uncharacterized protein